MVSVANSYTDPVCVVGNDGNVGSKYYYEGLKETLIRKLVMCVLVSTLVQDNASLHSSDHTKLWLDSQNIHVLRPAKLPDLNRI